METSRHHRLKLAVAGTLKAAGFGAIAVEVACPSSRFRVDVAGFSDKPPNLPNVGSGLPHLAGCFLESFQRPTTVIIECKQSRCDFLRDNRRLDRLLAARLRLDAVRRELEERIIRHSEPHLAASGTMLFAGLEKWDFSASRLPSYRAVVRDLRRLDQQIHGQTKFWAIARYALADVLLIAAPRRMVASDEVPPGWGLLEVSETWLAAEPGETAMDDWPRVKASPVHPTTSSEVRRARLLRNIAVAATRDAWRGRLPEMPCMMAAAQAPADSPTA